MSEAQRHAAIVVIRAHPEWSLSKLVSYEGPYAATIASLTIHDLINANVEFELPEDGGPPISLALLDQARRAQGARYDRLVLRVLVEANRPVQAAYIEARVGGPRWKRQAALRRLVEAGTVRRSGTTSATNYIALADA